MSRFDKKAVALKYNAEQDLAPVVIASGYGEVAENIIDIAEQRGIPVYRDDSAASMLCMLEIGTTIPREMYELVAAIYLQILKMIDNYTEEIKDDVQTVVDSILSRVQYLIKTEILPSV